MPQAGQGQSIVLCLDPGVPNAPLLRSGLTTPICRLQQSEIPTDSWQVDLRRRQYQKSYKTAQPELDLIAEQYPEFINDMQSRFGRRLLLAEELEAINRQAEHGALRSAVAESMEGEIADDLRALKEHDIVRLKLEPLELLKTMPFFQDISLDDLANHGMLDIQTAS